MSKPPEKRTSRRDFLKNTGRIATASALAGVAIPYVHPAGNDTVQLALIGAGGRGTGAVADAFRTKGPTRLVAVADVFGNRLTRSVSALSQRFADQMDVPPDRQFIGFDGYRKAMDCLRPGDVAIFASPPAFRWVHFDYAIQKGVNVFMEKPISVDGPSTRRMLQLAEEAAKNDLKVGVGLMCRHCHAREALYERIQDGAIGDITLMRAYRMQGPIGSCFSGPKPDDGITELLWQIQRFHSFLWASGGAYSDFLIHNIDECCMMKDAWPVRAQATGGRHFRNGDVDQNFDNYSVEYTFADGTKLLMYGRNVNGCHEEFASYAHGTKGSAVISTWAHTPAKCRIYKGHNIGGGDLAWEFPQPEPNPYQEEWHRLMDAIRRDKPFNEVRRGAEASLVTAMGRYAAHTGQVVTYDQMLHHEHEFAPDVDKLTMDSPAPLRADAQSQYPIPLPGLNKDREY